mgnify:CR=1 FL=1
MAPVYAWASSTHAHVLMLVGQVKPRLDLGMLRVSTFLFPLESGARAGSFRTASVVEFNVMHGT